MAKFLTHKGFSLLESLLVLLVLILAGLGVYKMFSPSSTQAAIKMEQNNVNEMVEGIFNAYTLRLIFQRSQPLQRQEYWVLILIQTTH